ncbi:hypothetical protein D3C77_562450 [compost metagenome]
MRGEGFGQRGHVLPGFRLRQPQFFAPVFTHKQGEGLRRSRHAVIFAIGIAGTFPGDGVEVVMPGNALRLNFLNDTELDKLPDGDRIVEDQIR